jgi:hypothetical protein
MPRRRRALGAMRGEVWPHVARFTEPSFAEVVDDPIDMPRPIELDECHGQASLIRPVTGLATSVPRQERRQISSLP